MDTVGNASREMIRKGSKSFAGAARLLAPGVRESVYHLYGWCRYCDDRIDEQELGQGAPGDDLAAIELALTRLREQTRDSLAGNPPDETVFVALHRVVERHGIPHELPMDLLRGFEMDASGRQYESLEDVLEYCYHVAGVVGVMMAIVMDASDTAALDRAADLGIALQMTNIARDVMDDASAGRVYLPEAWLRDAGVTPETVSEPSQRSAVFGVVDRFLREADRYYRSATAGLPYLPLRSAWAIATARDVYRDIGGVVQRRGAAAWDQRAVVSRNRKLLRVVTGGASALRAITLGRMTASPSRPNLWTRPSLFHPQPHAAARPEAS